MKTENINTLNNKAVDFYEKANYEMALFFADKALALDSIYRPAMINKANSLYMLKKIPEAMDIYIKITKIYPDELTIRYTMAEIYDADENYEKAANEYLHIIINEEKQNIDIAINLATELYMMTLENENKKAIKIAKKWIKHNPENPIALHTAAALRIKGIKKPEQINHNYVEKLFDAFADSFETVLAQLEYKSPFLVCENWKKYAQNKTDILDAGCGSGLCGMKIYKTNPMISLTGVDISKEMLKKAKEKNIYKKLISSELMLFLQNNKHIFNCIIAADVFTYFGNLENLFKLMAKNIQNNGIIIFTVTSFPSFFSKYKLEKSGRYMHSRKYIENKLKLAGFSIIEEKKDIMRYEAEKPVFGIIFTAIKNTGS